MKRSISLLVMLILAVTVAGCSSGAASLGLNVGGSKDKNTLTIVWYPNESAADLKDARDEVGKIVEQATGKKVEHKMTTDYNIAIEAIASGSADLAYMGPQGYVEARNKTEDVKPLFTNSGESGTLDDAVYYSWLNVRKGDEGEFKSGDGFTLDPLPGKKFSFVSNSSTSGFKVPSAGIISYFGKMNKYKDLKEDDLMQGGKDKFFSDVLFGGSHQGSAVNLLTGKADVAAFCDTCVSNYVELADGTANKPGAVYKVKDGAAEPFNTLSGKEFVVISVTPVLNSPFVANTKTVSEEDQEKITEAFTSDDVTHNPKIFLPKDSKDSGLFKQKSRNERFLPVDDAWFEPIRELSK